MCLILPDLLGCSLSLFFWGETLVRYNPHSAVEIYSSMVFSIFRVGQPFSLMLDRLLMLEHFHHPKKKALHVCTQHPFLWTSSPSSHSSFHLNGFAYSERITETESHNTWSYVMSFSLSIMFSRFIHEPCQYITSFYGGNKIPFYGYAIFCLLARVLFPLFWLKRMWTFMTWKWTMFWTSVYVFCVDIFFMSLFSWAYSQEWNC